MGSIEALRMPFLRRTLKECVDIAQRYLCFQEPGLCKVYQSLAECANIPANVPERVAAFDRLISLSNLAGSEKCTAGEEDW